MAVSTKMRLEQLTGSFGTGQIVDTDSAAASGVLVLSDLKGVLSTMASAVKRINGGTTFSANAAGLFTHNDVIQRAASANNVSLQLEADGGGSDGDKWKILAEAAATKKFQISNTLRSGNVDVLLEIEPDSSAVADSRVRTAGKLRVDGGVIEDSAGDSRLSFPDGGDTVLGMANGNAAVSINGATGVVTFEAASAQGPSGSDFELKSQATRALQLTSAKKLDFADEYVDSNSNWSNNKISLSDSDAEWDTLFANNGNAQVSIVKAINAAAGTGGVVNKYGIDGTGGAAFSRSDLFAQSYIKITNASASSIAGAVAITVQNTSGTNVTFTAGSEWTITADDVDATTASLRGAINGDSNFTANVVDTGLILVEQTAVGEASSSSISKSGGSASSGISLTGVSFKGGSPAPGVKGVVTPGGTDPIDLSGLTSAEISKQVDVYLNGQLLVSGAAEQSYSGFSTPVPEGPVAALCDYYFLKVDATAKLRFAFDIQPSDHIDVTIR